MLPSLNSSCLGHPFPWLLLYRFHIHFDLSLTPSLLSPLCLSVFLSFCLSSVHLSVSVRLLACACEYNVLPIFLVLFQPKQGIIGKGGFGFWFS